MDPYLAKLIGHAQVAPPECGPAPTSPVQEYRRDGKTLFVIRRVLSAEMREALHASMERLRVEQELVRSDRERHDTQRSSTGGAS